MRIETNIQTRHVLVILLFIVTASTIGLVVAYGGTNPPVMGHTLGEIEFPSGTVMLFNLNTCPPGWSELTSARGRYIVGLPAGGTQAGTTGTALSNLEDRAVGQHTHAITDPGHQHTANRPRISGGATLYNTADSTDWHTMYPQNMITDVAYTGITVQNTGAVPGTNAPYIQLLICQKV